MPVLPRSPFVAFSVQACHGARKAPCEPSTSWGRHNCSHGTMLPDCATTINARARSVSCGYAAKNASMCRAAATPSPSIAAHQRRRHGMRIVRSASVRMPCACKAFAARGASHCRGRTPLMFCGRANSAQRLHGNSVLHTIHAMPQASSHPESLDRQKSRRRTGTDAFSWSAVFITNCQDTIRTLICPVTPETRFLARPAPPDRPGISVHAHRHEANGLIKKKTQQIRDSGLEPLPGQPTVRLVHERRCIHIFI